jgi:hypothetical protein
VIVKVADRSVLFYIILLSSYQRSQNLQILNFKCPVGAKVRVEMPNPRDVLYRKMAGRGGWAHLDLADAFAGMIYTSWVGSCLHDPALPGRDVRHDDFDVLK